ncbi:transcription initiation factor IID, 18kD subunit-domain-containing protein [Dendryphion nanum]|uniref:Transcription initiation factor IID, 18kD subunit-domain-containing protein n=1 Tax=Dendryphion nanum TaxID=256645 RepID=A0A9P9IGG5_9PLEO|nr:transcription initiation factor IID, 18kD subunit-domain-containing protein [Dendryphion nanum]
MPSLSKESTIVNTHGCSLTDFIQMMFVSGETGEPAAETTTLIESIVQDQVQHMLRECTALATRRGSRSISTDDLMMLIRHDRAKISRLRHFLQWKDVRRSVKDSDDKGGDAGADVGAGDADLAAGVVGGGSGPGPEAGKKAKRAKVELVWEVQSFFNENPPPLDDVEDEEEEEMNFATLQRLKNADERTKNMTREEYVHWSDCRQASFTYRKGKRFKEWAGFGLITDSKPSDDIIDILGFLTFEIVQTLTEEALKVKDAEDLYKKSTGGEPQNRLKRKRERGLFDPPEEAREPVQPSHVQEAYRRLQRGNNKGKAMLNFTKSVHRAALKLVNLINFT